MKLSTSHLLAVAIPLIFLLTGCGDSTNPGFIENDYSTVPPLADYENLESVVTESGLTYYVIKEGSGSHQVQDRPDELIRAYLTLRIKDENILQSTYANGVTSPQNIALGDLYDNAELHEGIVGMRTGEYRVIIVPPDLGPDDDPQAAGATLIYEIEIDYIH